MSKEQSLVERLREFDPFKTFSTDSFDILNEAANCIEMLERQLALCKLQRNRLISAHLRTTRLLPNDVLRLAESIREVSDSDLAALERTGKHE